MNILWFWERLKYSEIKFYRGPKSKKSIPRDNPKTWLFIYSAALQMSPRLSIQITHKSVIALIEFPYHKSQTEQNKSTKQQITKRGCQNAFWNSWILESQKQSIWTRSELCHTSPHVCSLLGKFKFLKTLKLLISWKSISFLCPKKSLKKSHKNPKNERALNTLRMF